jgi:sodium/proline symporter
VNRFMAMGDERSVQVGRRITMAWAVLLYGGMLLLGWAGRVLYPEISNPEALLFHSASGLLPPVLAGIVVAALLSAVMSTADSQLLVAASSISHDLGEGRGRISPILKTRLVVVSVSIIAAIFALIWPEKIFDKVLSAWSAIGAAFGPLLIVRALKGPVSERGTLLAMGVGFFSSLGLFLLRKSSAGQSSEMLTGYGMALEYFVSFGLAFAIALTHSKRCAR